MTDDKFAVDPVGRKSRRGADDFPRRLCHAGFEPRRGVTTSMASSRLKSATPGRYEPHAWLKSGAIELQKPATAMRAEIFALPILGVRHRRWPKFVICHLSFVILLAGCATRPTFRTVVVDPGHGGHDPGTSQRGVLPEKYWTLDLAYRLKSRLEQGGFNVVLTRTSDVFIPLEDRVLISNSQPNVIFVSLHFNSTPKRWIQGVETYYDTGRSAKLANMVQKSILQLPDVANRRVKTAPYFVIRRNTNPAILVEGGFLSNPIESRRIASPAYRDALAEQIYQGILSYRGGRPPIQETATAQR
jgi:N-acetylmuramoyl-L-alanine amidase